MFLFKEYNNALEALLSQCPYIEDVKALKHFVFHPRLNGDSNLCLLCDNAVGTDDPLWSTHHKDLCSYVEAIDRLKKQETLEEYRRRKA
jgi:hypothetical protein